MCGVWALVDFRGMTMGRDSLLEVSDCLAHRGPDGKGFYSNEGASFVHRRLAILDLSDRSAQPLTTADGRFVLMFNGEIVNFRDIEARLHLSENVHGSDAIVLLRAIERWGTGAIRELNGMYSIVIWDRLERRLTLARDQFGIKPLYYFVGGGRALASSELTALRLQTAGGNLNVQALTEFVYFGNPLGTKTFYDQIMHVESGTIVHIEAGSLSVEHFAAFPAPDRPAEDLAEGEFRDQLEHAVNRHLVSDRPLALFLSGGLDSGSIAALASKTSTLPVHTVSVQFDGKASTDTKQALLTATRASTTHHLLNIDVGSALETVTLLAPRFGEPFGDAAAIPLYQMCLAVSKEFTVVLQGDGGDELMGGYSRYRHLVAMDKAQASGRLLARAIASSSAILPSRFQRYARALGARSESEMFGRLLTQEQPETTPAGVLQDEYREAVEACDPFLEYHRRLPELRDYALAEKMRRLDLRLLLPNTFLAKVDRATMAASVEARVPFLDREFASLALSIPIESHRDAKRSKLLLRRSMDGLLPEQVLCGPKLGFGVPVGEWMKGQLGSALTELLSEPRVADLLDPSSVLTKLDGLRSGRSPFGTDVLLYRCLQLALWRVGASS